MFIDVNIKRADIRRGKGLRKHESPIYKIETEKKKRKRSFAKDHIKGNGGRQANGDLELKNESCLRRNKTINSTKILLSFWHGFQVRFLSTKGMHYGNMIGKNVASIVFRSS